RGRCRKEPSWPACLLDLRTRPQPDRQQLVEAKRPGVPTAPKCRIKTMRVDRRPAVARLAHQRDHLPFPFGAASRPDPKGREMSSNPLHYLIDTLTQFIGAVWDCHHAQTKEEKDQTLAAWLEVKGWFWPKFRFPSEALRGLADPALAWCSQKGFRGEEDAATVELAARCITELAKISAPCADPDIYANKPDAQESWERQGNFLLQSIRATDDLP